ncbi:diguanylate cyclase [Amphritea sp. 2_MG-2023]|uniref:sensor domain-containing diguanylate cyclase n=1 Tax=Amphritea TaxID=515417 RepID=UPI001C065E70|nr:MULTISPECIES: diguanylate cyclase [Amphritea]MBU2965783.1 diguanylate cyclase [Amphritea atlantica]MDO6417339.1 diguanylate cyclase [Amphritea sp. 2_MG-2023]
MQVNKTHKRLFLLLSLLLFIADALFVTINYISDKRIMHQSLNDEGQQLKTSFNVALSMTLNNMSQLATFVASSAEVQRLFAQGVSAVKEEGGGPGGPKSARIRSMLYDSVSPGWNKMMQDYQVRQLHFHLGPGSTSFLRVHKPSKFGDNMDNLRYMVVDVNHDGRPRQGFELGRVYSGLRGIVPIFANSHSQHPIGALEVGTSFKTLIDSLSSSIDGDIAVLLKNARVENATWSRPSEPGSRTPCSCFIEATSSPTLEALLASQARQIWYEPKNGHTLLVSTPNGPIALTEFALTDYIGERDKLETSVGRIMIWKSAEGIVDDLNHKTWVNIIYAIVGFLLIEFALFLGLRLALRQLEQRVDERTHEIKVLNKQLEEIAHQDMLTGVYSRRYFMTRLQQEINRTHRLEQSITLLMLDVDHFKKVNDTWGHLAGDQVLSDLGKVMMESCRSYDVAGRYGGEEFCLLLPGVDGATGLQIAEKLRKRVELQITIPGSDGVTVTISIGVALYIKGQRTEEWLKTVDQAMYKAKRNGRNQCVLASYDS